jgi:DNA polymerase II small subunit
VRLEDMADGGWRIISLKLLAAKLFPAADISERLLAIDNLDQLISIAVNEGISGLLTDEILSNLEELARSGKSEPAKDDDSIVIPESQDFNEMVPVLDASKQDLDNKPSPGRVLAPISPPEPKAAERPHGLPHFSLDGFPMLATDVDVELDIHFDITGKSTTEGKLSDIISCFNSRLEKIKRMLVTSGRLPNRPIETSQLARDKSRYSSSNNTATIVGLVNDVRHKGENLHFKVEDISGEIFCVLRPPRAMDDSPAGKRRNTIAVAGLMEDDVVGVTGFINPGSRDMLLVEDIHLAPMTKHTKRCAEENQAVSAAFVSDIHVGSKTFLHSQWEKLVKWFHSDPLAKTIMYLVLSGDAVDGVGIYKDQDKELDIVDVYKQYEEVARLTELLPDWVETIILPGNHDAVRPAEPQPALDPMIQQYFNSATFVGNPCDFSLHGVRTLAYHGVSIMDFVSSIKHVTFSKPEVAMAEMLERRHLAPSWGGKTPLSPEPEDHMVIEDIPDIFVTGHVHGHYCGDYKGSTLIQSSTWQDQTGYMRMLGFQPKPCILTVVNLNTHKTASIPFA